MSKIFLSDFGNGKGNIMEFLRRTNGDVNVVVTGTVSDTGYIGKFARVFGNAKIPDNARVVGHAKVSGNINTNVSSDTSGDEQMPSV
jgi:hypothetical protein